MNSLFGYTQSAGNVSIIKNNATISAIFKEIKRQTGLTVFYSSSLLNDKEQVKLHFTNANVEDVINYVLKGKNLTWSIKDKYIILQKAATPNTGAEIKVTDTKQEKISGLVADEKGQPLPGVSVRVKGASAGVTTDLNGKFSLIMPAGAKTLVFSFIGFATQEYTVIGSTDIKIVLKESTASLGEVVVIGYGTVKKRDLTGSVASIKGPEIAEVPSANIIESVQGKLPGVDITRSSGSSSSPVSITVRGTRSLTANNGPLFIVDGVQYSNIQDINPNDIESMDVLKDASSTAIYGSRGANGVIILTTKKGLTGKPTVSFNSYAGLSQVSRYPNVMNLEQWRTLKREASRTTGRWSSPADDSKIFSAAEISAMEKNQFLDYQDLLIHDGQQQDYQLGINAGNENTKVYFSLDYLNEKGIFKMDWSNRYNARLNLDQKVGKFFKAGMQTQLTHYEQSVRRDPLNQGNKINPLGTIYDENGKFILYPLNGPAVSPLADEEPDVFTNRNLITRVLANAFIEVTPLKGLSFKSILGSTLNNNRNGTYAASATIDRNGSSPLATYSAGNSLLVNLENILNYQKEIGGHSFNLTGVNSFLWNRSDNIKAQGENQLIKTQLFYALENASSNVSASTDYVMSNLVSFAGRLNYSYKGKYLLTFTGRTDGSSILADGHKWAFFPSAAAAWRISDENFMKGISAINDLKLRYSVGTAGNYAVDPGSTQNPVVRVAFGWDDTPAAGYLLNRRLGNDLLGWENTTTQDIGLDFGILKNRISGSVDYYHSNTFDLLLQRGLPASSGATNVIQNVGKTRNQGIELALNTENIKNDKIQWSSSLTFTRNKGKIVGLASGTLSDIGNNWFVGKPVGAIYDYEKLGIWQTEEATEAAKFGQKPGDIKVRDLNNDGKIDNNNDRKVLGASVPKWYGGIDNTIKYKNFDFNFYVFGRFGQTINPDFLRRYDPQGLGQSTAAIDYWTPENPSNLYPRPNSGLSLASMLYTSTLGYIDGTFVRLRNVSLGYTLPKSLLDKTFVKNVRLYASGKNLFTWTKEDRLDDYDPERGGSENFPMTKLFVFGLNANF